MKPELCVGAVVVVGGDLLMVQRGRGVGQGLWSIPGGRVEAGETLATAVTRELWEETGLAGQCDRFLGLVERIGADHQFVILDYAVHVASEARLTARAGDDAAAVRWVAVGQVGDMPDVVGGLLQFLRDVDVVPS